MNAPPEREWYALARRDDGLVFCSCFEPIDWSRDQHAALMLSELEAMDVARRVPGAWAHPATLAAMPREPDSTVLRQALQWIADGDGPVGMRVIARRALAAAPPTVPGEPPLLAVELLARTVDLLSDIVNGPDDFPAINLLRVLNDVRDAHRLLIAQPTPPLTPVDEGPEATALRRLLDEELNVQRLSYGAWRVWDDSNAQSEGEGRTLVEALAEYDAARDDEPEASTAEMASDNALRERVMFRETRQMWLYGATAEQRREIYRSGARRIGLDEATVERLFPAHPTERAPTDGTAPERADGPVCQSCERSIDMGRERAGIDYFTDDSEVEIYTCVECIEPDATRPPDGMPGEPASELDRLAEIARAHVMTDEERAAQRESFVRGNLAFGSDADEARERQGSRAAPPTVSGEPPDPRDAALAQAHALLDAWDDWPGVYEVEQTDRFKLIRTCFEELQRRMENIAQPTPPLTPLDNDGLPPGPWDEWLHKPTYTGRPCGCEFEARVVCSKHCGGHGIPGPWPLPPTTPHAQTESREH